MANTPYPLPRETRESSIDVGDGTAGPYGPSQYRIFDIADVKVFAREQGAPFFDDVTDTVTVTKTEGAAYDTFSVTFSGPVGADIEWFHVARRVAERSVAVTRGGSMNSDQTEKELSKIATTLSELRRDVDRIPQTGPDQPALQFQPLPEGHFYKAAGDGKMVDAGRALPLPPGGKKGWHLEKASDADGDADWVIVGEGTEGEMPLRIYDPAGKGEQVITISDIALPKSFGIVGDGLTDDTEAIRAYHNYCNANRQPARYVGIDTIAIQSDAQIAVNTDVDFCGAKIKILDGINPSTPSFDTFRVAFVVADPDTPLVTGVAPISAGDLTAGSRTPTTDFWTDPGFVYFQGAAGPYPVISNRQGTGTLSFRQSFKVVKEGRTVHGLAVSMVGTTQLYYRARRNSKHGWVSIRNFRLNAAEFNNQMVFLVNRNQVRISDVTVDYDSSMPVSINEIFAVIDASDFTLENVTGLAQTSFSGNGTYIAGLGNCSEVNYINCTAVNGWGWQGSSNASGVYLTRCKVNRFDIHNGGFYFYADNCDFCEHGITFGWGGGEFVVTNARVYNCDLVNSRQDYGGYWFGTMTASNIVFERDVSTTATVFNLESNPVGVPILSLPLPKVFTVQGVHRRTNPTSGATYIAPIRIKLASGAQAVAAPDSISISNITAIGNWSLFNTIDAMNMTGTSNLLVSITGVHPTRQQNASDLTNLRTWIGIPPKLVVDVSANLDVVINNCSNVALDLSAHDGAPRANLTACRYINRAKGKAGGRYIFMACDFTSPVLPSGEASSPIGATKGTGAFPVTALLSCTFTGAWNLSAAVMLSGCMWAGTNDSSMILPSGATQSTAMSGWRTGF